MNWYQRKLSKRAKLIHRKSSLPYSTCRRIAKIRAFYDFYRIVG